MRSGSFFTCSVKHRTATICWCPGTFLPREVQHQKWGASCSFCVFIVSTTPEYLKNGLFLVPADRCDAKETCCAGVLRGIRVDPKCVVVCVRRALRSNKLFPGTTPVLPERNHRSFQKSHRVWSRVPFGRRLECFSVAMASMPCYRTRTAGNFL